MKTKISSTNLLEILGKDEYAPILKEFHERSFSKNSLIYTPYNDENLVFIVKEGKVRLYLAFEDKEFNLGILSGGDIYSTHTRAYVYALEDVKLLVMSTEKFYEFMADNPLFSRIIVGVLGDVLKQSFSIIHDLIFKDVGQRIVEFFLFEARQNGEMDEEGTTIHIDLTMEQLATIVGASRQTVSTIINDLCRTGILCKKSRGVFQIPYVDILKSYPRT